MKGIAERQALPPAFMRGEGHAVAGGAPRRSGGESLLSHGFAVPAPPEGKPRALRTVLAPRIYEGGGPRSGRGSSPPRRRGLPPQSRLRRAGSPGGRTAACQKSLAEFAARRRLLARSCAICTPRAYKSWARQTAILLSKKGKALFGRSQPRGQQLFPNSTQPKYSRKSEPCRCFRIFRRTMPQWPFCRPRYR